MRKSLPVLLLLVLSVATASAQPRFSAFTTGLLHEVERAVETSPLKKMIVTPELSRTYLVYPDRDGYTVRGLMRVSPGIDRAALDAIGVRINSRIGDIWSVSIPVENLPRLRKVAGLEYVELRTPVAARLDSARANTGTDLVLGGTGLPQAYTGNGVVIGVLDGGFDYTHPTFFDATGTTLRVSRVWDMGDNTGPAPTGYGYGTEFASPTAILNAQRDGAGGTHGTHVAGIAAGSGALTADRYRGFAPEADIVLVNVFPNGVIADAIRYVFDYATSVNRPAVINMSLGSHVGPHDGTSLGDLAFDGLIGNGRILVGAAGNEGGTPLHLSRTLTTGDTARTAVQFENTGQTGSGIVDCWGSPNSDFSLSVFVLDAQSQAVVNQSMYYAASGGGVQTGGWTYNNDQDTVNFEVTPVAPNPNNQRPNILVQLSNGSASHNVGLALTSTNSVVHLWNHAQGNGAALTDLGIGGLLSGDTDYTAGEIGGTSRSVISVGAYTSKVSWVDTLGGTRMYPGEVLGGIATFSSRGPTSDGRVKPEIAAPGTAIASAFSSFASQDEGAAVQNVVFGTRRFSYGIQQGTSMASPAVTGSVALLLQKNPALNRAGILDIFQASARQDLQTGTIPPGGNNTWGLGKIDVHAAIMHPLTSVSEDDPAAPVAYELIGNYPNPFNPATTLVYATPASGKVSVKVYDLLGREIATLVDGLKEAGRHTVRFETENLSTGVYVYRLSAGGFSTARTMVLMR